MVQSHDVIARVKHSIDQHHTKFDSIGINGISGVAVFYYYYCLFVKDDSHSGLIAGSLEKVVEKLNNGYTSDIFFREIIEFGHAYLFMTGQQSEDGAEILDELDTIITQFSEWKQEQKDLDPVVGGIAAGNYYLKRLSQKADVSVQLEALIELINDCSHVHPEDGSRYWQSSLRNKEVIELGIMHGIAGTIAFLTGCYKQGIQQEKCEVLIREALRFIARYKGTGESAALFPNIITDGNILEKYNYQNLCYGDVGIGYTFYYAGEVLKDTSLVEEGIAILTHAAAYRDDAGRHIKDANLLYGSSGLYTLFSYLHSRTALPVFKETADYWLEKTIGFGRFDTKWGGYESFYNNEIETVHISFLQGICGIGTALIASRGDAPYDYLTFANYPL
ncbi:lanthionine synthetase LanC family protein [Chitinophaga sp. S165]|uniref:lanthionine synthetase LanC family protein n=1 Tax=Chitinophaga sp. S165 TaxID=2135462 RepID=UPI000D70F1C2|nr:lanthionine synthetase LanC family protein [Chitinophaga sp. S165]PWV51816.1 lanthionine synthetase-like protein [Chitinophaga sp. S165]